MKHEEIKAQITLKEYAKQQIQKYLNEAVVYEAQIRVINMTLSDESRKEKAVTALTALNQQVEAGKAALESWNILYDSLPDDETVI